MLPRNGRHRQRHGTAVRSKRDMSLVGCAVCCTAGDFFEARELEELGVADTRARLSRARQTCTRLARKSGAR